MIEIIQILIASIFGTMVMTSFSYYISERFKGLFKEPVLLNLVVSSMRIELDPNRKSSLGWMLHFVIGLLFAIIYHLIWKNSDFDPTWFCGLIFGMISGIIGIVSWHFLFKIGTNPPKIKFKEYYIQLFVAHILFALAVVLVYKIFTSFEITQNY